MGLRDIDRGHGTATIGFWTAPEDRNAGYATAAVDLIVRYGLDQLRLHRIEASTIAGNDASGRVLEKIGFVREGRLREAVYRDGAYRDLLVYGLLG